MIDIFSRYAAGIILPNNKSPTVEGGIAEGINEIGNEPDTLYSYDDSVLTTRDMKAYFADRN